MHRPSFRHVRSLYRSLRDPGIALSVLVLLTLVTICVVAPLLAQYDPASITPRARLRNAYKDHWLGTDSLGRDLFARVLYGGRLSITISTLVCVLSVSVGLFFGAISGYFRAVDALLMRVMDGVMAIPGLLLAITLVALAGPNIWTIVLAITVPEIPKVTRLVRSVVLSVRQEPYVEAALGMGTSTQSLLLRHIVPSTINPLVVQASFICGSAILTEAALGFLGLGFPPEVPSLGTIIAEGRPYFEKAPWIVLYPGLFLALLILSINIFGDKLRDRLDPRFVQGQ